MLTDTRVAAKAKGVVASSLSAKAGLFAAFLALAVILQLLSGAYHAEFSSYPDEPAHYVTSLMLREYAITPSSSGPLRFAEEYYQHYPKVAFGHWPPVFYFVQAIWMLLFSVSRTSVRLELAVTTAALAFSIWKEASGWFRDKSVQWAPLLAALLVICLPLVQNATDQEMAESLLTLFCFWSTVYFARYIDSGKTSDALLFGLHFSLAVLTKGSGWMLVFIPGVALLLTRRWGFLWRRSFWLSALLVAVLCLPWQLVTLQSASRGWTGGTQPSLAYTADAMLHFTGILIDIGGPVLAALIGIGIVVAVVIPAFRGPVAAVPACMFALIFGDWLFHSVVPAGVEDRKMILAVPGLVFFLFTGGIWIAERIPLGERFRRWRFASVAALAALAFFLQSFSIPYARRYGYSEAAAYLVSQQRQNKTILVSSESGGEGLLISELAMRQPDPQSVVVRATKDLAVVDWNGTHYQSLFGKESEILDYLKKRGIDTVVLDTYKAQTPFWHQKLLEQTINRNPARFKLVASFSGPSADGTGKVEVYRLNLDSSSRSAGA